MAIRVSTKSKGYNTENELTLYVNPNDGFGYGQISVDGTTENINLKLQAKGQGNVIISDLYVPGLSGTVEDKINAIESVLATVGISGYSFDATTLASSVVTLENEMDNVESDISDLDTRVQQLSGQSATYDGGTVTGAIVTSADKNKISSTFKVYSTRTWGTSTYEGLPEHTFFKGMSAFVESTGRYYYASDIDWIPLQAENVYKTVYLSDDYIEHAHYASLSPQDAYNLIYGVVDYVNTESSVSCSSQAHRHLVRWTKDGDGKIVARINAGNHAVTPHIVKDEIGYHLLTTALENGVDENSVFQKCTLTTVEKVSGAWGQDEDITHTHTTFITVKQALELYKRQREFIETENFIQTDTTSTFFDVDKVDFVTGEPSYDHHRHYVTWKYEAGVQGIIRQEHLGQYSNGSEADDELHSVEQYDNFGYIRPCTVSINDPIEEDNGHTHQVIYTKSILNDIYTSLEATKFNKTGGIIHGRVGIRDGFTYIDAVEPVSGGPLEMVLGSNSTITANTAPSGALDEKPYWQHDDNHALKIGGEYVTVLNDRNLGVGEFTAENPPEADFHVKRENTDAVVTVEAERGWQPSIGVKGTSISGDTYGGRMLINSSKNKAYPSRSIGELIIESTTSEGISLAQGGNVGLTLLDNGDVEVTGNLVVYGDFSFTQTSETYISDNIIELNSISGSANLTGSGLRVGFKFLRGPGLPDYELIWNEQSQLLEGGLEGNLQGFPTHDGIIEGGAIIFGSGSSGANTSSYANDYTNLHFLQTTGLIVNPDSSDIAIDASSKRIQNVADPVNVQDALTLQYFNVNVNNAFATLQHHDINGLLDDDHTQYLHIDSRRDIQNILSYDGPRTFTTDYQVVNKQFVDEEIEALNLARQGIFDTHTANDASINDLSIHYRVDQIDHQEISNAGVYDHSAIDSHIDNTSNSHSVTLQQANDAQVGAVTIDKGMTFTAPVIYGSSATTTFHATSTHTAPAYFNANASSPLNPTLADHLTRMKWVEDTFVNVSGDTMTGSLVIPNATADSHALNRITADGRFVNVSGDTMTGSLTIASGGLTVAGATTLNGNLSMGVGTKITSDIDMFLNNIDRFGYASGADLYITDGSANATRLWKITDSGSTLLISNDQNSESALAIGDTTINVFSSKIINLADGTNDNDAVNKGQLDDLSVALGGGKVSKTGDSMQGDLTFDAGIDIIMTDTSTIDSGTTKTIDLHFTNGVAGTKQWSMNGTSTTNISIFDSTDTEKLTLTNAGQLKVGNGSEALPSHSFIDHISSGMAYIGTGVAFVDEGEEIFRINNSDLTATPGISLSSNSHIINGSYLAMPEISIQDGSGNRSWTIMEFSNVLQIRQGNSGGSKYLSIDTSGNIGLRSDNLAKITNLANGTSSNDAVNLGQLGSAAFVGSSTTVDANNTSVPTGQGVINYIGNILGDSWEETEEVTNATNVTIPNSKTYDPSKNTLLIFADGVKLSRNIDWVSNSTSSFTLQGEFVGFSGELNMMRIY